MVKASDMLIARRADTKARADFATWQMMVKLNGAGGLSDEARDFLARYATLCERMEESEANEETVRMIYAAYFEAMGGAGLPPPTEAVAKDREAPPFADNITPMKRPAPQRITVAPTPAAPHKRELPVRVIFVSLVLIAVAFHYLWR